MKRIKVAAAFLILFGIFSFYRNASAKPFAGNEMFPDVSNAEQTAWFCDGGETHAVMYRAIDPKEFRILIVVFTKDLAFVMDNKTEVITRWFLGSSLKETQEVEANGWFIALQRTGPNYYRLLRHKTNDCVRE